MRNTVNIEDGGSIPSPWAIKRSNNEDILWIITLFNCSTAADNFEINRRIVFYNGITGDYILTVEGKCSLGNNDGSNKLTVTYFAEQVESEGVSVYNYRVIFKPETIIPDIDLETSITD